jgi:hypothetical protein
MDKWLALKLRIDHVHFLPYSFQSVTAILPMLYNVAVEEVLFNKLIKKETNLVYGSKFVFCRFWN